MSLPGEERLPKDFGKYRLIRRIATGGMAEIFLAHRHDAPESPLVIKRILPHLAESSDFVSMFLDEARIAAQLNQPNIVQIYDVGQISGAYYIAMEYIHGEDVRRIYNQAYKLQRSLPLSHSIRVIAEAALGLDFAHRLPDLTGRPMGVVHRDVSPQNILVTYDGRVKVVDFGIAKAANKVNQTRAGVLKGKYSYMSPEQAMGDPIDHRTDIFALGIILYETTTGTRLFKRPTELATLQAVIKCDVLPPSQALEGYPLELERLVMKALAKRPADRYQSAAILSTDLYQFLHASGLYVEPDAIAEFMADLFADRLAEERSSGLPALPQEEEVRAEMQPQRASVVVSPVDEADALAQPTPVAVSANAPPPEDTALSPRALSTFADDPRAPPGFVDDRERSVDGGTVPEEDLEDVGLVGRAAAPGPRATPAINSAPAGPKPSKANAPSDQLPTVVDQAAYRDPPKRTRLLEPERAERPLAVEPTDFVRVTAPRRADTLPSSGPAPTAPARPKNGASARSSGSAGARAISPRRPASRREEASSTTARTIFLVAALFLLGLAAALAAVRMTSPQPSTAAATAPDAQTALGTDDGSGFGEVHISTEPNATIWYGDQRVGTANAQGRAGPVRLPAGQQVLRVSVQERGFTRERTLHVRAGGIHEIEIKAQKGWLRLGVAPWARVVVDGRDLGLTPLPNILLDEGEHSLELENTEIARRYRATVHISGGEIADVRLDLATVGEPL